MSRLIYLSISALLRFNDRLYGRGASREVLRDLTGDWQAQPKVEWIDLGTDERTS